jgi:hypothetical protein
VPEQGAPIFKSDLQVGRTGKKTAPAGSQAPEKEVLKARTAFAFFTALGFTQPRTFSFAANSWLNFAAIASVFILCCWAAFCDTFPPLSRIRGVRRLTISTKRRPSFLPQPCGPATSQSDRRGPALELKSDWTCWRLLAAESHLYDYTSKN